MTITVSRVAGLTAGVFRWNESERDARKKKAEYGWKSEYVGSDLDNLSAESFSLSIHYFSIPLSIEEERYST